MTEWLRPRCEAVHAELSVQCDLDGGHKGDHSHDDWNGTVTVWEDEE